jgi:hypothetical protein
LNGAACAIRPLALYIGGMGARSTNYYNDLARRLGYEAAAAEIQDPRGPAQRSQGRGARRADRREE